WATMLREEYRRGRLSWLQCWMVMSVARGEASEAAWVDYARQVTLLRLRRAVADARCRAASEGPCLPPPVAGGGRPPVPPPAAPTSADAPTQRLAVHRPGLRGHADRPGSPRSLQVTGRRRRGVEPDGALRVPSPSWSAWRAGREGHRRGPCAETAAVDSRRAGR